MTVQMGTDLTVAAVVAVAVAAAGDNYWVDGPPDPFSVAVVRI